MAADSSHSKRAKVEVAVVGKAEIVEEVPVESAPQALPLAALGLSLGQRIEVRRAPAASSAVRMD